MVDKLLIDAPTLRRLGPAADVSSGPFDQPRCARREASHALCDVGAAIGSSLAMVPQ
jgi:hypothetical protein